MLFSLILGLPYSSNLLTVLVIRVSILSYFHFCLCEMNCSDRRRTKWATMRGIGHCMFCECESRASAFVKHVLSKALRREL